MSAARSTRSGATAARAGRTAGDDRGAGGRGLAQRLAAIGLRGDWDFVLHLPSRYEDETVVVPIAALQAGSEAQIEGTITAAEVVFRGRRQFQVTVQDAGGALLLRFLHFYPSQRTQLAVGRTIRAFGAVRGGLAGVEMVHPRVRVVRPGEPLPLSLTPIYPTVAGVPQAWLRRRIERALQAVDLHDLLPDHLRRRLQLPELRAALSRLHHPPPAADAAALAERTDPAWRRLKFDELVAQQITLRRARAARQQKRAPVLHGDVRVKQLHDALPFTLTAAQQRVWREIAADLAREQPMQRLVQGDVGSGKTVVAALAAACAIDSGWQAALMAPTELLAEQHFGRIAQWLAPLGVATTWMAGRLGAAARRQARAQVADGTAQLVIGTHALIQEDVRFQRLGLAIIDEQHRFGVAQRLALRGAGELAPHLLMLSATPIPRTLAMSYLADLDVSVIDELPPGRQPVVTKLVAARRRDEVIGRIRAEVAAGRQAYWVCPLIEPTESEPTESEPTEAELTQAEPVQGEPAQAESMRPGASGDPGPPREARLLNHRDAARIAQGVGQGRRRSHAPTQRQAARREIAAATETHARIGALLPGLRIGLLHGQLPASEKTAVMQAFSGRTIDVLVATTVVEVGVDVPNATLMVIEHAERFGLAQLHQLRGRIGRGAGQSFCILLFDEPLSDAARERLRVVYETHDGFEVARRDLMMRGPGEFLGSRQSGVPLLRFADLERDAALVEAARAATVELLATDAAAADAHVRRWTEGRQEFLAA